MPIKIVMHILYPLVFSYCGAFAPILKQVWPAYQKKTLPEAGRVIRFNNNTGILYSLRIMATIDAILFIYNLFIFNVVSKI
jgi:hypothetical protein